MSTQKKNRRQQRTRVMALVIAGVMIFSVLAAAIMSQIW